MLTVDEHRKQVLSDSAVEADVELLGDLGVVADHGVEIEQALKADLHDVGLRVFDSEQDGVDDGLELFRFEV